MNRSPEVTVIVGSYNRPWMLGECLKSVLAQEGVNWECIVTDDGSTEPTRDAVPDDPRISFITGEHAGHLSKVFNRAIEQARGEYVAFTSDDDMLTPRSLAVRLGALRESNSLSFACGSAYLIGPRMTYEYAAEMSQYCCMAVRFSRIRDEYDAWLSVQGGSVMAPMELFHRYGLYDEHTAMRFGQDRELWARWINQGVVPVHCGQPLTFWRHHPGQKLFRRTPQERDAKNAYRDRIIERRAAGIAPDNSLPGIAPDNCLQRVCKRAMGVYKRLRKLGQACRVFSTFRDAVRFRRLCQQPAEGDVSLRIRALGGLPVVARARTTDANVLRDTFYGGSHLPPVALPDDAVILDCGANAGYTAAHFAALYPRSRVVAVEMDRSNCAYAQRNLAAFGDRVSLIHAAVWAEDGSVGYGGVRHWGFRVAALGTVPGSLHTAPALTLDTIVRQSGLNRIDYLKMDIEGSERQVLQGNPQWLRMTRCIGVEVHSPATIKDCVSVLRGSGFRCVARPKHPQALFGIRDDHD